VTPRPTNQVSAIWTLDGPPLDIFQVSGGVNLGTCGKQASSVATKQHESCLCHPVARMRHSVIMPS